MRRIQHPLLKCVVIQRVMLKVCGFCANILIYVINAGYLSRAWEAFFFLSKGGLERFLLPSPWGSSVKCKQEAFEPQRLTPVVNPSVSDKGHRS